MIDWNKNKRIDATDVGISIALNKQNTSDAAIDLLGFSFSHVQYINPVRNPNGKILLLSPHILYKNRQTSRLHRYGIGPFCRFTIDKQWSGIAGVYALCDERQILYIGQSIDLAKRFNAGYGNISPRNCFEGGQSTNCKINTMILKKILQGQRISLYFHRSKNYINLEQILLQHFHPPYNSRS